MNKTNTGPRYLRLQRYWFENQANTQHISTWSDICNSLRIDDDPEFIETIALKVSIVTYRTPVLNKETTEVRILE